MVGQASYANDNRKFLSKFAYDIWVNVCIHVCVCVCGFDKHILSLFEHVFIMAIIDIII